jgi:hypothetical protein
LHRHAEKQSRAKNGRSRNCECPEETLHFYDSWVLQSANMPSAIMTVTGRKSKPDAAFRVSSILPEYAVWGHTLKLQLDNESEVGGAVVDDEF